MEGQNRQKSHFFVRSGMDFLASSDFLGGDCWVSVVRPGLWPSNVLVGPFPRTLPWAFVARTLGARGRKRVVWVRWAMRRRAELRCGSLVSWHHESVWRFVVVCG